MSTTVIIAEDNALFRETLVQLLSSFAGSYELVGKAKDGREALHLVEQRHPDLLILDLHLPALDGFKVMKKIREKKSEIKILVMTISHSQEHVVSALKNGADAYCTKTSGLDEFFTALDQVMEGNMFISRDVGGAF